MSDRGEQITCIVREFHPDILRKSLYGTDLLKAFTGFYQNNPDII
ncbi:MAG: hypothetical protein NTV01_04675 [Bacteroidia bacterium]|nr:hypothetical protein [Bacteroidia bacterium]